MNKGYSICFNQWALDKSIKNDLGLLLIISSLTAETGVCFASNKYFSEKFGVDEKTISRKIKKLIKAGYIIVSYDRRGAEVVKREIRLTKMLPDELQKSHPTSNKKVTDNITSINNSYNQENDRPIPTEREFMLYVKSIVDPNSYQIIRDDCILKYKSWVESGWVINLKNGKQRPIKNWKTTILNTLPYIKQNRRAK